MDLVAIANSITLVWEVFSAAPSPFIFVVAVFCGLTWIVAKFVYRQQIATLRERLELAHDQAQATRKLQIGLEARIDRLQAEIGGLKEAIQHDATERREEVSSDVGFAVSATDGVMLDVMKSEGGVRSALDELKDILSEWEHGATKPSDVLSADDLKRIPSKDKDKD